MYRKEIVVLGTMHHVHYESSVYSMEKLREILASVNPSLILAELSPEQFDGQTTSNTKPEYNAVILPYASMMRIRVIPFQPSISLGNDWGDRKQAALNEIKESDQLSRKWKLLEEVYQSLQMYEMSLGEILSAIPNFHFKMVHEVLMRNWFPNLWKVLNEWNQLYHCNILESLSSCSENKVVITVGYRHKYWIEEKLSSSSEILLHNAREYYEI